MTTANSRSLRERRVRGRLISARLVPHAWHTNSGSRSDSRRFIGPSIRTHRRPMAAVVIGAVDQQAMRAHRAHFPEVDFLLSRYQGPSSARSIAGDLRFLTLTQSLHGP